MPSSDADSASRASIRSGVVRKASLSRFDQASSTSCDRLPTIRTTASSLPLRTRSVLTPNHCAHAVATKSGGKPAAVTRRSLLIEMPAARLPVEARALDNEIVGKPAEVTSLPLHPLDLAELLAERVGPGQEIEKKARGNAVLIAEAGSGSELYRGFLLWCGFRHGLVRGTIF